MRSYLLLLLILILPACSDNPIETDTDDVQETAVNTSLQTAYDSAYAPFTYEPLLKAPGGWRLTFTNNFIVELSDSFSVNQDADRNRVVVSDPRGISYSFNIDNNIPSSVDVLTDSIQLSPLGTAEIRFTVSPAHAHISADMLQLNAFCKSGTFYFGNTALYNIKELKAVTDSVGKNDDGEYIAVIQDLGIDARYNDDVKLVIKCKDVNNNTVFVSSNAFRIRANRAYLLPTVYINTPGAKAITSKTTWVDGASMLLVNANGSVDNIGSMSIRGRGNSSWSWPKKPYAIKLDKKHSILGMPKHKRWVLLANAIDRTLLRNDVTLQLGQRCKGLAWTPHGQHVELVLNGKHKGNYYLCEQIKIDKNRVDLPSGGYIFELDKYYDEPFKFRTKHRELPVMLKCYDEENFTETDLQECRDYFNQVEELLYANDKPDARYRDLIDIDSYIDFWLVNEICRNWEPNHPKSVFMYKEMGGKLFAGPLWDFDWNTYPNSSAGWSLKGGLWYKALFNDPVFIARVKEKWNESKADFEKVALYIDIVAPSLEESNERNFKIFPIPQKVSGDENLSYNDAILRLRTNLLNRIAWMDTEINRW